MRRSLIFLFLSLIVTSCKNGQSTLNCSGLKIAIYGDSRSGHTTHQSIVDLMEEYNPYAVFHTGDLVNVGTDSSQWVTFNSITSDLRASAQFYPALGNHERNAFNFFNNFNLPNNEQWYSVNICGIHFVVLNSTTTISSGSEQREWLVNDLSNISSSIKHIVAIFHHPPFSTGSHTADEMDLQTHIVPLFQTYNVKLVFNGHEHNYERSEYNGTYYVVAGGGGAPIYPQSRTSPYSQVFSESYHYVELTLSGNNLAASVVDINSDEIDSFEVSPIN